MKNTQIVEVLKYLIASYALIPTIPVKNGKRPVRKPRTVKAAKATWTLDAKRRGRVPNWVLNQYRSLNKAALLAKFKDGHKFVKV